mmetsp:Transcript_17149/g.19717  ORF Transcript_17149/g.19717 Transcript_17149/m.19717 type:complete len:202 (+) Transcript_17149:111-716(+)
MWNARDIVTANDAAHVWVQEPNRCYILERRINDYNPPKPPQITTIDSILWNRFVSDISQQVTKLNSGQRAFLISYLALIIPFIFFVTILPHVEWFRKDILPLLKFAPIVIFPLILTLFFVQYIIIALNKKVDEQIKAICESYNTEFNQKGYSIQYRTKWTGFCKPKHALPARAVAFVAVPEYVEKQKEETSDLINREAWGL